MAEIDIGQILERRTLSPFLIRLVVVSWFATFLDGFDTGSISFVAPYLAKDLALSHLQLGNLFSVGVAGLALGSLLFGYVGDLFGRRPAILLALGSFGLLTLFAAAAPSYGALAAARFVAGIGLGGALPLIWAVNLEFAPRRVRTTVIAVIMVGYTLGAASAGPVTIALAPAHGWRSVFFFGGTATLIAFVALALWLPESARFLFRRDPTNPRLHAIMRKVDPTLAASACLYACADEQHACKTSHGPAQLFAGSLRWTTPALWVGYICSSAIIFLNGNWTPIILETVSFKRQDAAWISSSSQMLGCVSTLIMSLVVDRKGPSVLFFLPAMVVPVMAVLAAPQVSPSAFLILFLAMYVLTAGAHNGLNSIAGRFYPTHIRSVGAGWALAVSKVGGVLGPLIGGLLLSSRLSYHGVFVFEIGCGVVLCLCLAVIARIYAKQGWA